MRLAVSLLACLALPAQAQEMDFDPDQIETCLSQLEDRTQSAACIGRAALSCMEQPMGETTMGMGFCLDAERTYWDSKLNTVYQMLRADFASRDAARDGMAPAIAEGLRDMQRAWIAFRDARCSFEAAQWHGGTAAGPAYLGCAMQMTAEQTLYLTAIFEGAH